MKTEIITIKKLKKDGTIDAAIVGSVADFIKSMKTVIMPVDSIYGVVSLLDPKCLQHVERLTGEKEDRIVRMISSFKMLDEIANINKLEFDFLHRIWPGELIVFVEDLKAISKSIPVRMPKGKYQQEIIDHVGRPLVYTSLLYSAGKPLYRKKDIIASFEGKADCVFIIEEFCKEHSLPSVVDISKGTLDIINEGRISAEELKSLYFLGKDDSAI
ncbi:MAG: Sua5/YciO/YrdC/YwlC family protein [Spirochaetes bacterium]|nr:Sua5/YciO/YrdC/YwlC family protein [Spirochaetota bacterium]